MAEKNKKGKTGCDLTVSVTEGPFYKPGSPERSKIAGPGSAGSKLTVEGLVSDRDCRPVSHALIEFWHADGNGNYDNEGFNLRGRQYTDEKGRYRLETVRPSGYTWRTAHIHVKVRAKEVSPVLTTQLFFPGEPKNKTDEIFKTSLLMDVVKTPEGEKAAFNFVVNV